MKHLFTTLTHLQRRGLISFCLLSACVISANAQVKGLVFRDYDLNGIRSDTLPIEVGVPGVTVFAFVNLSKTPISATTAADGSYFFSSTDVPAGKPVRIEFRGLPMGDFESPYSPQSATRVQFVTAPATGVNLGINYPLDYCQPNGLGLVIPIYVNGNTQLTTDQAGNQVVDEKQTAKTTALVSMSYTASGIAGPDNYPLSSLATAQQVGAVWGLAYQRRAKQLLSAATVKRHMSFGPLGTGGLYLTDLTSGTTSNFIDLKILGIDTGEDPHSHLFGDKTQASTDPGPMTAMGRISLGGIDLSEDEKTLYLINLKDRKLYGIFIDSPARTPTAADVKSWTIPDPGCANGDFRPWAVKVYRGQVYIGVVCSAETSQQPADLKATVYRLDPAATPAFEPVLSFPLDFRRGPADGTFDPLNPDRSCLNYDHWLPWTEAWPETCGLGQNPTFVMFPQPILSSLAFDDDGSLLLGFLDRFGYLSGWANHDPQGNGLYNGFTAGDILRAYNANGTFVLESNGIAGNRTGSGVGNNEGPGGGEFYGKDEWFFIDRIAHSEVTNGSLLVIPGSNEVVSTAYDPLSNVFQSAGLKMFSNTTGQENRDYVVYTQLAGSFGKAGGIGDIEPLCDPAPIEIGNRLWFDDNRDGIQDPYEPGIDGITLTLHDMETGGNQVATQTTHDGGQFYFNNTTVLGGLKFTHNYQIRMDTAQLSLLDITLEGVKALSSQQRYYSLSPSDQTGFTDADLRDSDARLVSNSAVIDVTTSEPGHNDFTNDLAIYSCPQLTNGKHLIELCADTKLDLIATQGSYFSRVDSVQFVVFSTPQSGTAMYGNGGTVLGTVMPDATNRAVLHNPTLATANNTSGLVNQYIYAIIFPMPENPGCRQSDETVVTIFPALSVSASGGGLTCTVKTVTVSSQALYGNGSAAPDAVYRWTGPTGFTSSLQNPTVSENGSYTVTVSSLNCLGNPTMAEANVTSDTTVPDLVAYGNALPCVNCSATLLAEAPGATFVWTGPNHFISTAAEPEVTIPGEYTVTAKGANGCEISATAELLPIQYDPCPPLSITVTGGELTCAVKQLTLTSKVTLAEGSAAPATVYSWTGPNGFTSSLQNPTISVKGSYTVTVSLLDCPDSETTVVANVTSNTVVPILMAYGNALPCVNCSATLLAEAPGATFFWTGPKNFTSTAAEPEVSIPGEYTVTAKGTNGCEISATAELQPIANDPCQPISVTVTGGQLTCSVKQLTLTSRVIFADGSSIPASVYSWTGASGFTSSLQNPTISTKGSYTLTVSVPDCPDSKTTVVVNVTSDTAVPNLMAYGNALPCVNCSAALLAEAPGATFFWMGPNNFTSTAAEPEVSVPGEYTVTAKGANGCEISATAELQPIANDPCQLISVTVTGGKLTCTAKSLTLTSHVTFADGSAALTAVYAWKGPNSFTSSLSNPVISAKGSYTLTISISDCPDSQTTVVTNVTSDTAVPNLVAYGGAIPCPKCSTTLLAEAPGATFKWTGPKGFTSTEAEATVTVAGDYTVTATGANGCSISTEVELLPIEIDNPCKPICIPITIKRIK